MGNMPTIAELVALWLEGKGGDHGAPTGKPVCPRWQRTRVSLARHLVAAVGNRTIETFGVSDIWRVQAYGRDRGLSAETVNKVTHHLLPAMLRDLEAAGVVAPKTKVRTMAGAEKLRADGESVCVALTLEERDRVLRAFAGHWAGPLVYFLFFTGLRVGEACGLRQRDVDWHRRTCRVMRSRCCDELSPTKSRRSQRVLQLPRAAVAAIATLRRDDDPEAFIFRGAHGRPLNTDSFRLRTWGPTLRRNGCRPIRIHDTRHTFATLCLEAGVPVAKVAAYLGDKISTVEARYAHVIAVDDWDRAVSAPELRAVR